MFKKHFNEALTAIIRNRFLSAVTILSIAFILLIFNVLLAVNQLTQTSIQNLSEKLTLTVYLKDNITNQQTTNLIAELNQIDYVESVTLQSATEAYEKITQKYPDTTKFLTEYNILNPLPATLNIQTESLEDQKQLISLFQKDPYIDFLKVDASKTQQSTIRKVINNLIQLKSFTLQIILWVTLTFTIGGALLIFNAINVTLFSRRKEIQIMQFVGATHNTIKKPFIIEGIIYSISAFIISGIIIVAMKILLPETIRQLSSVIFSATFQLTMLLELIIIATISGLISNFTTENYLRTKGILAD